MRKDTTLIGGFSKYNHAYSWTICSYSGFLFPHHDRKFQKGKRPPQVGDEIEFDGHLVTVENVTEGTVQPETASVSA